MLLDFDHHATTPLDPRVLEAMLPYLSDQYGNPSSLSHRRGLAAAAVELAAREQVAGLLGVAANEIVWTSGATEANNLAIKGVLAGAVDRRGLVTVATEHRSVLDPARRLARAGHPVMMLPVDGRGQLDLDRLESAITPETALVSVMWANNEIGTIAPLPEIAAICCRKGVWLHSDATQAVGKIPVDLRSVGVDLLSFSAHKLYGPPGIGALVVRRDRGRIPLVPQIDGGGQQSGIRSGTLPLALIVGLAKALELCEQERESTAVRMAGLRDRLWSELVQRGDPSSTVAFFSEKGRSFSEKKTTLGAVLPHTLNVGIPDLDGDALLVRLQQSDLCVSSGAACSSNNREPSHVLTALGVPERLARASVRFGLGKDTAADEVSHAARVLSQIVIDLRSA
jgi:cysteine desulfurase